MHAVVITVGDEILRGHTLDTNFHYLARQLAAHGMPVTRHASVADNATAIREEIRAAIAERALVLVTGGLGGTPDDITLDAVAAELGREAVEVPELIERFEAWYRTKGREMPKPVRRIARRIEGSELLANSAGQAPGVWLDVHESHLALMPGVPAEMRAIMEGPLAPRIAALSGGRRVHVFRIIGIGEAQLAQSLAERDVDAVTYLPSDGRVDVCLTVDPGDDHDVEAITAVIRDVAGDAWIGDDRSHLDEVVFDMLRERKTTLAVAESLTGGALGATVVASPGASEVFVGATTAYADEMKMSHLDVKQETLVAHGAVSAETAREMAAGIRARTGAAWGISTTGIAGPTGATDTKPRGLVYVGIAYPDGRVDSVRRVIPGNRAQVIRRTVVLAFETLRRGLLDLSLPEER
jgi:nicotinamide-nucleotide amidase